MRRWGINMLFVVGGEGGNMMGAELAALAAQEGFPLSVIGMPKSIENDLLLVDRCFGFDTAVENAQAALLAAKVEASSAPRGVGLVKVLFFCVFLCVLCLAEAVRRTLNQHQHADHTHHHQQQKKPKGARPPQRLPGDAGVARERRRRRVPHPRGSL